MLDLGTIAMAMGMQSEMSKVRQETQDADVYNGASVQEGETTMMEDVAAVVGDTLNAVEDAAGSVVSVMNPGNYAASVLDACAAGVPSIDLSLPTAIVADK